MWTARLSSASVWTLHFSGTSGLNSSQVEHRYLFPILMWTSALGLSPCQIENYTMSTFVQISPRSSRSLFPFLSRDLDVRAELVTRTCCLIVDNMSKFAEDSGICWDEGGSLRDGGFLFWAHA